ncbi:MAG: type II toxin-antitoxin system VapC family toxin [Verrucomicrobia bacterium]|nr:type II toxin-antitoxin system VapC family toxin [Verrucomicrobiota bacterium]
MKIALDTNAYVDFCKGEERALRQVRMAERIFLPLVVVGELRAGFLCGSQGEHNERILRRFLNASRVEILCPDDQTTHHYARLFFQLKRQGTPIPTNDLWIAALVSQHNLMLCARDAHFDHLPQLPRV